MKAMILAAGLGTRLRPLTLERPKPAMPLLGKPIVARLVEGLMELGVTGFRINLHHLPDTIRGIFRADPWDKLPVSFSYEEQILGTAGGLKANEAFFDDGTFLMVNGKIVMTFPLKEAIRFHQQRRALATLVLVRQQPPYRWFPVRIDDEGRLQNFKGAQPVAEPRPEAYVFTGIHIIEPEIFRFIPPAIFFEINDQVYPAAMEQGLPVYGFPVEGYWGEPSNPWRYLEAQRDLFEASQTHTAVYVSPDARISSTARLGPFVSIGAGCVVEDNATIENAILWENVHVRSGAMLRTCVIGSDVIVAGPCTDKVITRNGEADLAHD